MIADKENNINCVAELRATSLVAYKKLNSFCQENSIPSHNDPRESLSNLSTAELLTRNAELLNCIQEHKDEINSAIIENKNTSQAEDSMLAVDPFCSSYCAIS